MKAGLELAVDQDLVDNDAAVACEFLRRILGLDSNGCLLTDQSTLSDFSGSGMDAEQAQDHGESIAQLFDRWDAWVLARIQAEYGLVYADTTVLMVRIFADIENAARPQAAH